MILTVNEALGMHRKLIAKTGGLDGVRDIGILEMSVLSCTQTFNDEELYPSVIEKAARVAFSICKNHPFVDGNKRTAILCMLTALRINQIELIKYTQTELVSLGLGIADGSIDYQDIVLWIKEHS